ncbi:MAG: aminotransferase class III-fold pyridoxal phosphate-dependent enzyme, partial [Bacteroidota bacterium]
VEGIQGIGGIYVPDPAFLEALQTLCSKYGSLLILDEIQSGYGRSGRFFAFQYSTVEPDIVSMAKGMGNGFPIGGILIHPRIAARKGMLGTTFGGNHLACAAGIAVLDVIEQEDLVGNAQRIGEILFTQLKSIGLFREVRGRGLMIGLQMDQVIAPLRKKLLFEQHIFAGSAANPNTLRLLPPLNIAEEHCRQLLHGLDVAIRMGR